MSEFFVALVIAIVVLGLLFLGFGMGHEHVLDEINSGELLLDNCVQVTVEKPVDGAVLQTQKWYCTVSD